MKLRDEQINLLLKFWIFYKHKKKKIINNFKFIFKNNDIEIVNIQRNNFKIYAFEEFYTGDKIKIYNLLSKFNDYFQVIKYTKNEILFLFDLRLFKIYFTKKYPQKIKSVNLISAYFHKIKFVYVPNIFFNLILRHTNKIFFNDYRELSFDQFKEINLKYSYLDNSVRHQNLNLITSYEKNLKIKEILNFFKLKKNKNKIFKKIFFKKKLFFKSLNSKIPIYINKDYWNSSNFYLISNIIYGFYKKNFQYESQNKKNNFYKILIKKKISSIKNITQITKIISSDNLVIINNRVYNSRNRILAMIGHILNGGKYIKFRYKKSFDTDTLKQKLINYFAEYFSVYKYSEVRISNLDSNYSKVFGDRGLNMIYNDDFKSFIKKREVYFSSKLVDKKFKFIEVGTILDLPTAVIFLLLNIKKKINCFYLDHNKRSTLFNKKKIIRHSVKIFLTLLKMKPKILFVLEK